MNESIPPKDLARFLSRVDRRGGDSACWRWTGGRFKNGYGRFHCLNSAYGAHCIAFLVWVGPIPEGMCVCHDCPGGDNRWCVNPAHLWLGTKADNARDMVHKGRANGSRPNPEVRAALAVPYRGLGLSRAGEANPFARLTEADIRAIRARWSFRRVTMKMLAAEYGVHEDTIAEIVHRRAWAHVD